MSHARYKICLIGDGGVGKTTLINRYISGKYSEDFKMTIGVDFYTKNIEVEDIKMSTYKYGILLESIDSKIYYRIM